MGYILIAVNWLYFEKNINYHFFKNYDSEVKFNADS